MAAADPSPVRRAQSLGSPLASTAAEDSLEDDAIFSLCCKSDAEATPLRWH